VDERERQRGGFITGVHHRSTVHRPPPPSCVEEEGEVSVALKCVGALLPFPPFCGRTIDRVLLLPSRE
jgi:hypothetical protein